ncbi:hypothetical protein CEP51_002131 [Fusarium floridanum]|uniref:Uncharacterized protein n=1 Tax=Fusarium floridanum TaxID=1325733 RepID=A0A428SCY1_9HYPO|nr:hypothetical protein CEP51_002131 [Fusarium floridanum]
MATQNLRGSPSTDNEKICPACLNLEHHPESEGLIGREPPRLHSSSVPFICTVLGEGMAAFWGDENWEDEEESEYSYDGIASDENGDDENDSDTDDYGPRQFLPDCPCDPTEALQDGESGLLLLLGKATLFEDLSICLAVKPVEGMQGAYRRVGVVLDDVDILERGGPASRFILV